MKNDEHYEHMKKNQHIHCVGILGGERDQEGNKMFDKVRILGQIKDNSSDLGSTINSKISHFILILITYFMKCNYIFKTQLDCFAFCKYL